MAEPTRATAATATARSVPRPAEGLRLGSWLLSASRRSAGSSVAAQSAVPKARGPCQAGFVVSEVRETQVARATLPPPAHSGSTTWILVTCVALVCGGVLALAVGGEDHARAAEVIEIAREVPLDQPVALPAAHVEGPITLAAASEAVSIEMYSATWCGACAHARRWLGEQGITYHEIDVDTRADAMGQLSMLNPRRTLPTFDIDGDVVIGFDSGRLSSTIEGAARRHR